MADNGTAASGPTIAWDDIGGVAYQRVKVTFGAAPTDVDTGAGLPVAVQGTVPISGTFWQATQPVSAVSLPLPTGAALDASVTALSGKFGALGQAAMAASAPVVIASDQAAIPVTVTSTTITGTVAATQSGTWNVGSITTLPALVAGAALIGKVGIDQTTPGTTNKVNIGTDGTVAIGTALPAGTNAIGKLAANAGVTVGAVEIAAAQTLATVTTVGSITTLPALAAGAAIIGKVGIDQTTPGTTNKVSIGSDGTVTLLAGTAAFGKLSANAGVTIGAVEIAAAQTLGTVTTVSTVTNLSQLGGAAIAMGSGLTGTGVQRVVLATDVALPTGSNVIGALSANQSVNVAQMNGVTVLMGNGASGTGAQRVTIANDSTGILAGVTTVSTVTNLSQMGGVAIALNTGTRSTGTQRVTIATDDLVPVSPPTLTKATQGSTGFSTQDLKDAGRSSIMVTASVASTATSETLISVNTSKALAGTGAASSNTITTGKRFRIQGIFASVRNTTGTTAGVATLRLRAAVAGSTTASSPLQLSSAVALPAAATSVNFPTIDIPDGFEIDSNGATNTWGLTITHPQWVNASVVATFDVSLIGYEY